MLRSLSSSRTKLRRSDLVARLACLLLVALGASTVFSAAAMGQGDGEAGQHDSDKGHWAFRRLRAPRIPDVQHRELLQTPVDAFIQAALEREGLTLSPPADRATWLRRVWFDLTGLPPDPADLDALLADRSDAWQARTIDCLLASPRYGERWGKYWLDVAGYADSNGYFNADSDRPLAYRYRDYVIRAFNADKPFDQFVREQLAGDELAGYFAGSPVTDRTRELLTATHFLRNAPDGTSESDGNPDELTVDRATALQGSLQITLNALLGLTIQCARCHEHKFEPIGHEEYYRLESVFYPALPAFHADKWIKPKDRVEQVADPQELAAWQTQVKQADERVAALRSELADWVRSARPRGDVLFEDHFDARDAKLAPRWTNTAPGDDAPGGNPPVQVDSTTAPAAAIESGALQIIAGGAAGDRWLATAQSFDWTPEEQGGWVQATFDLVANKVAPSDAPAARIAYYIALHDFDDNGTVPGGNILLDGNPAGSAAVFLDYPGDDQKQSGAIGISGYKPGHNFGVRVTNLGEGTFRLEQLVDWVPENKALTLSAADLPEGAFGFEYCCGRSFVVDNVVVERGRPAGATGPGADFAEQLKSRRQQVDAAVAARAALDEKKPGKLAFVRDILSPAPDVFLLERGSYSSPGPKVQPAGLAVLSDGDPLLSVTLASGGHSTGRRLAFARWITESDSRAAALLARVMANRVWQQHFGRGLVATPDNFGLSGAQPSHPELLEYLATELVRSGWSIKALHRLILASSVYQQTSRPEHAPATERDPENRLLGHFPLRRLDAEAIRDGMLAAAGELDPNMFGPYTPTTREGDGAVVVRDGQPDAHRRSIYLQQRRTQVATLLRLFDAPSITSNCPIRGSSTVPLQSLALLNSDFVRGRAAALAERLAREAGSDAAGRIERAYRFVAGREPHDAEAAASRDFVASQQAVYGKASGSDLAAWTDFCQMLLASNAFLYIE